MIIWGGVLSKDYNNPTNNGGRYNPATDSWTLMSTVGAPTGRLITMAYGQARG